MRINTLLKTNERPNPYIKYYLMAILLAIVFGYLLIFTVEFLIIVGRLLIKYWYAPIIILLIIILLRRRKKKVIVVKEK